MLSSFTSMLPSGIGFSNRDDRERERERERQDRERERAAEAVEDDTPRANENNGKLKDNAVDEHGAKKRRERNPNETFIVVRPPPSVSNHPLNLQIQLVPPQAKERAVSGVSSASGVSSRPSGEYASQTSEEAAREPSLRLHRTDQTSFYASSSSASMSSIASTASTTSTSGGRRMIVPLYNLSAHNVMTNTILDAGTDAKVAKLYKRGMEILALAVLECVEVWPSYGRSGHGAGHVAFLNVTNGANLGGGGAGNASLDPDALLVTPTSSAISLSSAGSHPPHSHQVQYAYAQSSTAAAQPMSASTSSSYGKFSVTPTQSPSGAKRIFGKIFKKRDSQNSETNRLISRPGSSGWDSRNGSIDVRGAASPTTSEIGHAPQSAGLTPSGSGKRRSLNASSPTPSHFTLPPVPGASQAGAGGGGPGKDQPQLQPAVLGIQPTLSAPIYPPAGRPTRYVWIVRKWLKGSDGGLLGGVMRGVSMVGAGIGVSGLGSGNSNSNIGQGQAGNAGDIGVEVRFEWVRGQSKSQEKRNVRKSTQAALGKRGSVNYSQEDAATQQPRRSLIVERSVDGKQQEKSRSRGRGRPATAAGTMSVTSRVSGESRRSAEHAPHDSRTNSMTSAFSEEAQAGLRDGGRHFVGEEDEGEDSDPEDSETPWTCTLVVSGVPSNPANFWEHEHADGHALAKRESRRSYLSSTGEASQSSHAPPNPNHSPKLGANSNQPPPLPPKSRPVAVPDAPGTLLKLKVGALSPAPHHPKVVAQLKVPYPLPDVEVTRARVRKRVLTPEGVARPVSRGETFPSESDRDRGGDRPKSRGGVFGNTSGSLFGSSGNGIGEGAEGIVLTAEEIKDVLSCTAFWIVVREGFGGVGKVNRKGDGWRIRG